MRFGVFDHIDFSGAPPAHQLEERLRLAEVYDRLGFHAYHVAEHHGTPLGLAPSPNILLAALAQRTQRLRIGSLVNILPLYHPVRLVEEVCMLDHLSGGRLQLGVGRGISPVEIGFYDVDPDDTRELFAEALDVLLKGLTSKVLTHHGEHYRVDGMEMTMGPLQQPHPPLWFGIGAPDRAPWAAARDVNVVALVPAERVRPITDRYREEWAALGKPADHLPLMGVMRNMVLAETDEEAMRVANRAYAPWKEHLGHLWQRPGLDVPAFVSGPSTFAEWHRAGGAYAGTPEGAREFVARQLDVAGANYLVADLAFGDMTFDEAARSAELLATEVMPAVAEAA
jgi:alkanesulfonate monooxygenase SsuD/methylene tetrahydromethanopterin reductase-like flavin-dependent oxidoreductase (luciferase family)